MVKLVRYLGEEFKNKQKNIDDKLIIKAKKYLSKQLKIKEKYLEFMEVWVPGFKNKIFLQFMVLDPNKSTYGSTATYELEDEEK